LGEDAIISDNRGLDKRVNEARQKNMFFKPESRGLRRLLNMSYINTLVVESLPFENLSQDFLYISLLYHSDVHGDLANLTSLAQRIDLLRCMDRRSYRLFPSVKSITLSSEVCRALETKQTLSQYSSAVYLVEGLAYGASPTHLHLHYPPHVPYQHRTTEDRTAERLLGIAARQRVLAQLRGQGGDPEPRPSTTLHTREDSARRWIVNELVSAMLRWKELTSISCTTIGLQAFPNLQDVSHTYQFVPAAHNPDYL
jgi:hypothetical protein